MSVRITQQQLESYLWGAATLLRGTIDAGDYKQFIFPLLFFKRLCDVFDEETARATLESSGFELAHDDEAKEYFWRHQKDRAKVRQNRKRRREMGRLEAYRSEEIELITRRDLDEMRGSWRAPFAETRATMRAW